MSESIAARVDDDTAEWLEQVADQEGTTISKLVASILKQHTRDVGGDDEPDSTEVRLNQIEERIVEIERDIRMLSEHAEDVEYQVYKTADLARSIELTNGELPFAQLPTNDEGNVYPNEKPKVDSLDELL
jgi:uncharacterized membrane-anchored protein YjiN (DUF445 family)